MYKSDQELFDEAQADLGAPLHDHPQAPQIGACAVVLVSLGCGDLRAVSHEQTMVAAKKLGFEFADHNAIRLLVELTSTYERLRVEQAARLRTARFASFEGHFFRDRNGRLMARFSMGTRTFRPIVLEESYEQQFALVYQSALATALELATTGDVDAADSEYAQASDE